MRDSAKTRVILSLCVAALTVLAGCATPARPDQMVALTAPASRGGVPAALRESIGVRDVTGGRETNPMWISNVGSAEFERASGRNVFQREIGKPFTEKMSDAFIGSERMKSANEGAVRRSIEVFIEEILRMPVGAAQ